MSLRSLIYVGFASAALISMPAHAASSAKGFVEKVSEGNAAELALGKLALEKANNPEVKSFAQHIVDDHQKSQDELKQVAQNKGLETPDKIGIKQKATQERLQRMSGASFDKAYIDAMVKEHQNKVKEFERQAQSSDDPEIKNWAAQTVPKLQQHLQTAKALQNQLQSGGRTSQLESGAQTEVN